jgi:hypothetical protein
LFAPPGGKVMSLGPPVGVVLALLRPELPEDGEALLCGSLPLSALPRLLLLLLLLLCVGVESLNLADLRARLLASHTATRPSKSKMIALASSKFFENSSDQPASAASVRPRDLGDRASRRCWHQRGGD